MRMLLVMILPMVFSGCATDKEGHHEADTGSTCPNLDDQSGPDSNLYTCDSCGDVYACSRHDGVNLTWAWSTWACECVGDSGQLLIWDSGSQTGNPACVYTF